MNRSARARIFDIADNIEFLTNLMEGRTIDELSTNIAFRYALNHAVLIITEAVRHLPNEMTSRFPEIAWRDIVTTGNVLRHEYFRIDPEVMWSIVTDHLPKLWPVIMQLMAEERSSAND